MTVEARLKRSEKVRTGFLVHAIINPMRSLKMIPYLLALLLITSCSLYSSYEEEIAYTIPAGAHYSTHAFFKYVTADTLSFSFRFDDSAIYDIGVDQSDINKLFGFAEGAAQNIHEYSARFGWRWVEEGIEILGYCYVDGERSHISLGEAVIGTSYSGTITSSFDRYTFTYRGNTKTVMKSPEYYGEKKYISYPYFGGNITAPHEVTVWVTTHTSP